MRAKFHCYECEEWFTVDVEYAGDLPEVVCPKCKSHNIYFGDIESDEETEPIKLGNGGCGRCG